MDRSKELSKLLIEKALITNKQEKISGYTDPEAWIFDCRRALSSGHGLVLAAEVLGERLGGLRPCQFGTLESSGIILASTLAAHWHTHGCDDTNVFFVRKSRKKNGLMRYIEGTIDPQLETVLVDDIINSGDSLWKAVLVLEQHGCKVSKILTILRYRDLSFYQRFTERGIEVESIFTLDELAPLAEKERGLKLQNFKKKDATFTPFFKVVWHLKLPGTDHGHVLQKSQPSLDNAHLFFGGDDHAFYAIRQDSGAILWRYPVGTNNGKSIFSNPVTYKNLVIFGAYDGSVYALQKTSGELAWKYSGADWVGSSPAISENDGIVFIGLEFGLFRKHGGIASINAATGQLIWRDTHPSYTHSSPVYIKEHNMVVIGCNDGKVRSYHAKTGKLQWHFSTIGSSRFNPNLASGFGEGDIKEGVVYDAKRDIVAFGSIDGHLYILDRATGKLQADFVCESGIFSTPLIHDETLYFTSTDKHLRAVDLHTYKIKFAVNLDDTRLFSDPAIVNNKLLVGTNGGRLYVCDPDSGKREDFFQTTERLTGTTAHNPSSNRLFLRTNANEILCLEPEY